MKSLVCRTNVKSTVNKHSNQIDFVLVRRETGKICIKSSKCFLPIKTGGKTVRFLFDKNIQKWQCVVLFDNYVYVLTNWKCRFNYGLSSLK